MNSSLLNRRDIDFLLFEWLEVEALCVRPRFADHSRESITAFLDLAEKLAESKFLSHYKKTDEQEPRFANGGVMVLPEVAEAVRAFAEAGFLAAPFDTEHGGLQLPETVHSAAMAHFFAANIATASYSLLTVANARLLTTFGTQAQIDAFALPQIEGRMLGTMCLSEPEAGSSLADITTFAVADGTDPLGPRYRIFGNKMWISGGDHDITANIVHLVLAKARAADGTRRADTGGMSLFIVPKHLGSEPNDVTVAGLNHKMGYRGTSNCLLNFGEGATCRPFGASGAVGYRIGAEGDGLAIMFHMMNEARIGVGCGAMAVGYRGYLLSVQYASQRVQGRAASDKAGSPVPIIQHADVKSMLIAQKSYVEGGLALILYCARLVDEIRTAPDSQSRDDAQRCLDLLTPIAKTWTAEWGLAANDLSIQVHGGYGYTRDFHVEQLYRDNRLNPIHEGTTGIQGIDLVGRKIRRDGGKGLAALARRASRSIESAKSVAALGDFAHYLERRWKLLESVANSLIREESSERALWHATTFLRAFGHTIVGWLWLEQATRASRELGRPTPDTSFYAAKLRTCRYFFEAELPKTEQWLALVASGTDVAALAPPTTFDI